MTMTRKQAATIASRSRTHESRVMGGIKAAKTRGFESFSKAGKKGAASLTHEQRSLNGIKSAKTRGHEEMSRMGRIGGLAKKKKRKSK